MVSCLPDPQSPRLTNGVSLMLEHRAIIFPVLHTELFSTTCVAAQPKLQIPPSWQRGWSDPCTSPGDTQPPRRSCAPGLAALCQLGKTPRDGGVKLPFLGPVVEKSVKHYVDPGDFSWKEGGRYSSALGGEGV